MRSKLAVRGEFAIQILIKERERTSLTTVVSRTLYCNPLSKQFLLRNVNKNTKQLSGIFFFNDKPKKSATSVPDLDPIN